MYLEFLLVENVAALVSRLLKLKRLFHLPFETADLRFHVVVPASWVALENDGLTCAVTRCFSLITRTRNRSSHDLVRIFNTRKLMSVMVYCGRFDTFFSPLCSRILNYDPRPRMTPESKEQTDLSQFSSSLYGHSSRLNTVAICRCRSVTDLTHTMRS